MADNNKLAEAIAKKLYKTKSFYVHGEIKKKIDSEVNVFEDLKVKFKGMEKCTKGQLLDLSEEVLKKVTYRTLDTSDHTSVLMKNFKLNMEIFQSNLNVNDYFMFDIKNRELVEDDPRIYLNKLSKEERSSYILNMRQAKLTFDAYNPDPIISQFRDSFGVPLLMLNHYRPPSWQTKYPTPINEEHLKKLPKIFEKYINFIFPIEEERDIYWAWVGNALTHRHQSILHLRGSRGNGKTILAKITGAIVGYCYEAKEGVNPDGFNADLRYKRLVNIDDDPFIGTKEGYLFRKKITNNTITINEKFKQTTQSEKQFASYIVCSNPEDKFYVMCDERKMVQLTLNDNNINTIFSEEELGFLDNLLKVEGEEYSDKELKFLAHLGHYVLNFSKKKLFSATHNYLGGCFWEDVLESLGAFKKYVVQTILSKESTSYKYDVLIFDFKEVKTSRQQAMKFETISKFLLNNFTYKGEKIVERIDVKNQEIFPIAKYRSDVSAFNDEEEFDL